MRRLLACALLSAPFAAAWAAAGSYRYDTVHSQVVFSIDHNGYSRPFGRLHIAGGTLRFDPADWSRSSTELDIDLAGLDMGDADWNKAVCKPDLLDCARHPTAHFASTSVERKDDSHGVLHGQLTLRGVTRPVDVPFRLNRHAATIYGMHSVAGFSATAMLDRDAFGVHAFSGSIGHDVSVWLEIEAIADSRAADPSKEQP
ncbi:YceI family protein [Frateuria sp. Soil773]|uniref:YceI family protein n=1 Tax=Frateuria sp. Soil773 TaxID=1736407 RepID=UPI000A4A2D65|nr:YceI family protein [Frateuria sp. Soil773]